MSSVFAAKISWLGATITGERNAAHAELCCASRVVILDAGVNPGSPGCRRLSIIFALATLAIKSSSAEDLDANDAGALAAGLGAGVLAPAPAREAP